MFRISGPEGLKRIVILNPKGGSGKTTLAFNIAGYLANSDRKVALVDLDRQASSSQWLRNRPADLPEIVDCATNDIETKGTGPKRVNLSDEIDCVVIDSPGGLAADDLIEFTCGAHAILVPVMPSELDIRAAARLVSNLLLKAQVSRTNARLAIVANRVKARTIAYRQLSRFLRRLSIRVVAVLRDSQNYVKSAANGKCIFEMPESSVAADIAQWESLTTWLEERLDTPLTARDWIRPDTVQTRFAAKRYWAAAASAVITITLLVMLRTGSENIQGLNDADTGHAVDSGLPEIVAMSDVPLTMSPASNTEGAVLRERWKLSGVARGNGQSVLILENRVDGSTRRLTDIGKLDGWAVRESGPDYAVLGSGNQEVRLDLADRNGR